MPVEKLLIAPASLLALAKKRVLDWEKTSNDSTIIVEMRFLFIRVASDGVGHDAPYKYEVVAWVFKPFFIFMPRSVDAAPLKG